MTQQAPLDGSRDPASRVAWTYLASVLAGLFGGLVALIAYQVVRPLVCANAGKGLVADCKLLAGAGLVLAGFLIGLAVMLLVLKLADPWWLWLLALAGVSGMACLADFLGEWWFWVLLLLVPAAAALGSLRWVTGERAWLVQRIAIAVLALAGVAGAAVMVAFG